MRAAPTSTVCTQMANDAPAQALYSQGTALWNAGRKQEAIALLDEALKARPDYPEALCMGGFILGQQGKIEAALQFYNRALTLKSDYVVAWSNFGRLLHGLGRHAEALAAFERASSLAPTDADAWNDRACALRDLGRVEDSARAAQTALQIRPAFAQACVNLGNALLKMDRMEPALQAYRRAANIDPNLAAATCGQALCLRALGRLPEALDAFEKAEQLGSEEAVSGKGCLHLTLGDFERGWEGYEARWIAGKSLNDALGSRYPTWSGADARANRVLVINDHGLGDTIQFVRYLPLMNDRGVAVTLLCASKLHRLLASAKGFELESEMPEGPFDAQIAISSLPYAFKTRLETIPSRRPYLHAEPERVAQWAKHLPPNGFKIGVVWQGNPNPEADMSRSMPLISFAPIAAVPGVRLISLQKGFGEEQLTRLPPQMDVHVLREDFDTGADAFVDTAAVMMSLDLIITCDTSIAHLAGALGRPVWVALKMDAEWRWMRNRADSPWYPSMRLFRQKSRGSWRGVFEEMANRLAPIVSRPAGLVSEHEGSPPFHSE